MGIRRTLGMSLDELWNDAAGRSILLISSAVGTCFLLQLYTISASRSLVLSTCAWLLLFSMTTLAAALISLSVGKMGHTGTYSYGLGRAPVLAVFASTVLAILAAIFICKESCERLLEDSDHAHVRASHLPLGCLLTTFGLLLATYGVKNDPLTHVLTASSSSWLQEHCADIANALCSVLPGLSRFLLPRLNPLTILNAAATSVSMGTFYLLNQEGYWWADSAGALVLSFFIMGSMLPLTKYTGRILLQTTPPHLVGQIERCVREAERLDGVLELTNAHFWQLDFKKMTGTVTVRIRRDASEQAVLTRVTEKLFSVVQNLCVQVVKDTDWRGVSGGHSVAQFMGSAPAPANHGHSHDGGHGHSHDEGHGHSHGQEGHGHGHGHDEPRSADAGHGHAHDHGHGREEDHGHGHSHGGGHGHSHSEVMHH